MYYKNEYSDRKICLVLKDLSKTFPYTNSDKTNMVLENLSVKISDGEFVTILGKSGCGKSTLLNIIAGFENSFGGEILIDDEPIRNISKDRVMLFQESALFPWLTAFQNIEIALQIAKTPKEERDKIITYYLGMVGLSDYPHFYIHQLSGGMKQRISLARALCLNPKILLMDEPFTALDISIKNVLYRELSELHKKTKKTILFVTHNINEAVLLGDRVILLSPQSHNIKKDYVIDIPTDERPYNPRIKNIIDEITCALYENK